MFTVMDSPLGLLLIREEQGMLTAIDFADAPAKADGDRPVLREARAQLAAYFAGRLRAFDLPLDPRGTAFQLRCWEALRQIPYGRAITYGEEAKRVGNAAACRAVGGANGRNPLPIVIPCHRVLASGGRLGGYSAGLEKKRFLLDKEGIPYRA